MPKAKEAAPYGTIANTHNNSNSQFLSDSSPMKLFGEDKLNSSMKLSSTFKSKEIRKYRTMLI